MATTVQARGAGGVVWTLDVPPEGTMARERFDAQVAKGELTLVDDDGNNVDAGASADADVVADAPPKHGAGSGRDAWAAWAKLVGVDVTDEMSRDDIIAAVEAAEAG